MQDPRHDDDIDDAINAINFKHEAMQLAREGLKEPILSAANKKEGRELFDIFERRVEQENSPIIFTITVVPSRDEPPTLD